MSAPETRAILIGGASHSGKSTLAAALGTRPGWTHISTDALARHLGRPWAVETSEGVRGVKPYVAEHYRYLSVDELIVDVLSHYKSMWPGIEELIASHVLDETAPRLVLEGSALWPDAVATLEHMSVCALWLMGSDAMLETRIKHSSNYEACTTDARLLIDKFIARTLRYNALMMTAVGTHGLTSLDVAQATLDGEDLVPLVLEYVAAPGCAKPAISS